MLMHKKFPQNFWIASEPPLPTLIEETQIKAAFVWGSSLRQPFYCQSLLSLACLSAAYKELME